MKTFKKIMAAMMAMIMMTGCSNSNTVKYDQTFDTKNYKDFITIGNDVNSFNYLASHLAVNLVLAQNLNDGLVETDKYGNLKAAIAQDVGVSSSEDTVWEYSTCRISQQRMGKRRDWLPYPALLQAGQNRPYAFRGRIRRRYHDPRPRGA